jgi:hypothetical protein
VTPSHPSDRPPLDRGRLLFVMVLLALPVVTVAAYSVLRTGFGALIREQPATAALVGSVLWGCVSVGLAGTYLALRHAAVPRLLREALIPAAAGAALQLASRLVGPGSLALPLSLLGMGLLLLSLGLILVGVTQLVRAD